MFYFIYSYEYFYYFYYQLQHIKDNIQQTKIQNMNKIYVSAFTVKTV